MTSNVGFVLITRDAVLRDPRLTAPGGNGRKVLATALMPGEVGLTDPVWDAPAVLPTGDGGLEVSTFTEFARQDRHLHRLSVEIYTVLRGTLRLYVADAGPYEVRETEEIVILPGTVHEIIQGGGEPGAFELLVRVHAVNCHGAADKFVQLDRGADWRRWSELGPAERARAYRKQDDAG